MSASVISEAPTDKSKTTEGNAVDSARIGWAFLSQYYAFMNKSPSRLHCFYDKDSTLVHSTEGDESSACYGQAEIHDKIMSLDFSDAKVYISNVDSQASANGGIMVQVIGELSNRGQAWRKFAQTFFLAEQPNGYYVLNDICRYLKEDTVDYTIEVDAPAQAEATPAPATAAPAAADVEALKQDAQVPAEAKVEVAVVEETKAAPAEEEAAPDKEEDKVEEPVLTNGHATAHEEAVAKEADAIPAQAEREAVLETATEKDESITPTESEAAPSIVEHTTPEPTEPEVDDKVESTPSHAPEPAAEPVPAAAPAPSATPMPATPKTWATLAASNKNAWGSRASEAKGVSSAAPVVANAAPAPAPAPAVGPSTGSKPQLLPNALSVTSPSVFVKGVVETIQDDQLRSTLLTRFGPMKECDIIRSKACAFVEFEKLEHARRAIQASFHRNDGGEGGIHIKSDAAEGNWIHIVARKPQGERGPPSTRGQPGAGRGGARGGLDRANGSFRNDQDGQTKGRGGGQTGSRGGKSRGAPAQRTAAPAAK